MEIRKEGKILYEHLPSGLVAIDVTFPIDQTLESPDRWGARNLALRMAVPEGFDVKVETRRDSVSLRGLALSRHSAGLMKAMVARVVNPPFSRLSEEKGFVLSELRRTGRPLEESWREFLSLMYKGHPYSRRPLGTEEAITEVGEDDLSAFYSSCFGKPIISIVGDLKGNLGDLERIDTLEGMGGAKSMEWEPEHQIYREEVPCGIPWVYAGYPAPPAGDEQRVVGAVIRAAMWCWVWDEIRDKRGWAHFLYGVYDVNKGPSSIFAWAAVPPRHAEEALEIMAAGFERLADDLPSEEETKRWVRMAKFFETLERQAVWDRARKAIDVELAGFDWRRQIQEVKPEDIRQVARQYFGGKWMGLIWGPSP